MKQKLTSLILALAVLVSLSVPAFAACGASRPAETILYAFVCRRCDRTADVDALLGQLLAQYAVRPSVPKEPQNEPAQPAEQAQPGESESVPQPEKPSPEGSEPSGEAQPQQSAPASSAFEREVIRLVNEERAKEGLAPLTEDAALTRTARMKSQDMHDHAYFDHNSPNYGTPFQLMKSQGITYHTAGENIAMGYRTPEAVVSAWMNSSGHRANILNASYTRLGVGYVADGSYWTQHFTG